MLQRERQTQWNSTDHLLCIPDATLCVDLTPVPAELSQCVWSNCCQLRRHKREARCFHGIISRLWSEHSTRGPLLAPLEADEIRVEVCTINKTQREFLISTQNTLPLSCRQLNMKESECFPVNFVSRYDVLLSVIISCNKEKTETPFLNIIFS